MLGAGTFAISRFFVCIQVKSSLFYQVAMHGKKQRYKTNVKSSKSELLTPSPVTISLLSTFTALTCVLSKMN